MEWQVLNRYITTIMSVLIIFNHWVKIVSLKEINSAPEWAKYLED